jgi:hypothetical protein
MACNAACCATTDEQWQAIIDLIDAAPALLAGLKELLEYDENSTSVGDYGYEVMQRCKAAVAKAEPKRKVKVLVTVEVEVEDKGQGEGVVEYAAHQVYTSPAVEFISKTATRA